MLCFNEFMSVYVNDIVDSCFAYGTVDKDLRNKIKNNLKNKIHETKLSLHDCATILEDVPLYEYGQQYDGHPVEIFRNYAQDVLFANYWAHFMQLVYEIPKMKLERKTAKEIITEWINRTSLGGRFN